jgi:hypothetical protein
MRFSNNNQTWSVAESFADTKTWTLDPAEGPTSVYAQFSDKAGNWSQVYAATIILDTTPPQATVDMPRDGQVYRGLE